MKKVAVLLGSSGDLPVCSKTFETLDALGVPYEAHIFSAHRLPDKVCEFAKNARDNGFGIIIACAGKAAHLAGAVAAQTTLPVIGVPVPASQLDGLDALLSTVQMPSGLPVAAVAIGGAENAALLAVQILSVNDPEAAEIINAHRICLREKALKAEEEFQLGGHKNVFA